MGLLAQSGRDDLQFSDSVIWEPVPFLQGHRGLKTESPQRRAYYLAKLIMRVHRQSVQSFLQGGSYVLQPLCSEQPTMVLYVLVFMNRGRIILRVSFRPHTPWRLLQDYSGRRPNAQKERIQGLIVESLLEALVQVSLTSSWLPASRTSLG